MLQSTDLEYGRAGGFRLQTQAMEFASGRIYGILGPNGSGKSTFLHLLTGLLKPHAGTVTWRGKTRRQVGARHWAQHIATVAQEVGPMPQMTVEHYVSLGLIPAEGIFGSTSAQGLVTVAESMRTCNVAHLAEQSVAELSGGQRQRVRIARALAQTPHTLILDEPGNHLDLQALEHLAQLLRDLAASGLAIVVSMHDIDLASQLTDEVTILHKGRTLAQGHTQSVLTPEIIQRCWGVEMMTVHDGTRRRYLLKY